MPAAGKKRMIYQTCGRWGTMSALTGAAHGPRTVSVGELGHVRHYAPHQLLFCEGDNSDFVVSIVDGHVKLVVTSRDGKESVLGVRGPGELVGELGALDSTPRMASAVAIDAVTARTLTADDFANLLTEQPGAAFALIRVLVDRLREADRRRVEFGTLGTTARVAGVLRDLVAAPGRAVDTGRIEITISQQELAGSVGASRESVVRAVARLRARGLISTGRGRIIVLDADGLRFVSG